ncbi:DUF1326 domain-containing protein [Defluviimonas sp. WL0002]|uniref:DUF1326 domain-containing protein n=1 Tax=Albidovulum marisflavi TaxID=2984159 RepID=A0ABT2ZBD4_9RHOB|nr:DUF1326 domain-containing protein [Defluviimonas sp. WL0002]MCV2868460.1 DUF1326 domain-containing protein [Defluviimonas sp. WL0002]
MTPWELHGRELANCNCATGCPCQFMALPTKGNCEAAAAFEFDSGHYGDVDLGGTRSAMVVHWPGPIHEGNGTMQIIIDEDASAKQREALYKIMTGEDTEDMATMWWVFSAMSPNKLETLYKPVKLSMDMESRKGRANVADVFETEATPILNPVTGAEHRARINLPHGFEFRIAEMAKGTTRTHGAINLPNNNDTHVHMVEIHLSHKGVVEAA